MKIARQTLLMLFIVSLMSSCVARNQNPDLPTPDVNAILTAGVGTLAASIFQTQTALVPPATETPASTATHTSTPVASPTSSPTTIVFPNVIVATASLLPSPTGTQYTSTPNPAALGAGCNNLLLIRDETIPAGTAFNPQQDFTKTWKVENNGTCDWVYLYSLVFVVGERMQGEPSRLGKVIQPGKWTQLSISLTAPKAPGTYTGYWRMADQAGTPFGSTLAVSIVVNAPTNPPPPTATYTLTPTATPTP